MTRSDLTPEAVASTIDTLDWLKLHALADEIRGRMAMTAEAPGTRLHSDTIHSSPDPQPPRSNPWCKCGHASLLDHHADDLARALRDDLARDEKPTRYRDALVRAAEGLWQAGHRSLRQADDPKAADAGVERSERIISQYVGWTPERVSSIESMRGGGYISPGAVRRLRSRDERHSETGMPGPPKPELREQAIQLYYGGHGHTYRSIAAIIGVSHPTIMRWIDGEQSGSMAA